ncbi:hypothetical protein H4R18_003598 [Coemansia javaensis]|uniref:RNA polymerase II assembly factor Rtp1 C-terminal domain-containing protein n=1 Tax=Coemansia javaensis TaxID=2761396 RepID=A0A9W8LI64_9FUNG|nr:hypothetical protein H4R18_003598 [Coemansia javaensis]
MSSLQARVTQGLPALVRLAGQVELALGVLKGAAQRLSKGGVSGDFAVLAQLPALPVAEMLSSLVELQAELAGDRAAILGMRDRQVVTQGLDLVLLFEVHPRLAPGVGVPASKRMSSEAASVVSSLMRLPNGRRNWQPDPRATLADVVERLVQIADGEGDLASLLGTKYHSDIVAALFQLAYAPRPPASGSPLALEGRYYVECDEARRVRFQRAFTRLFQTTNPYQMLETLTGLLNEAGRARGPRWMAAMCSRFLARVVMRFPNDGARICLSFLVGHDEDLAAPRLDRIARLLISPPAGETAADYCRAVVPQIVRLAGSAPAAARRADIVDGIMDTEGTQRRVAQAAAYALRVLAQENRAAFREHAAEPACRPLKQWFTSRTRPAASDPVARGLASVGRRPLIQAVDEAAPEPGAGHSAEVASPAQLAHVLGLLHQVVPGGVPPAALVAELVCPVLAPLVHWHAFELCGAGPDDVVPGMLREVLVASLRALPRGAASTAVLEVVQLSRDSSSSSSSSEDASEITEWPAFRRTPRGTELAWCALEPAADGGDQRLAPVDALVELLGSAELREIAGDVFLALLREQDALRAELPHGDAGVARRWWLVSQAALAAINRLGPAVLARHADVLAFVLGVLDRHGPADEKKQGGEAGAESEASLALMLLAQVMAASEEAGFGEGESKDAGIPRIEWGAESLQLLRRIQARVKQLGSSAAPETARLCGQVALPMAMVLALHGAPGAGGGQAKEAEEEEGAGDRGRVVRALRDVRDDLVPVRAHGIVELRNLVLARSPALIEDEASLEAAIAVFVEMVGEADSFVYLNAIRGLASLADLHLRRFLPQLVGMYTAADDLERRTRVGEALLQSVQRAGALLGDCAPALVPPLLDVVGGAGAASAASAVGVQSALAILSAVAHTFPLALQRWADQLVAAVHGVLVAHAGDAEFVSVRRAAVVVLGDLVAGHGARLTALADGGVLGAVQRALRLGLADSDELASAHARSALDQLGSHYLA